MKYGWKNISHEILSDNLDQDEANRVEREMIAKFNSVENGYNVSTGGGGTYGIPCSEETRRKIGNANRGKPWNGIDNFARWRKVHGSWNRGGHLTPEQYLKIVAERRARCNKAITAYDPITNRAVLHFDSCANAANTLGVLKQEISRCARGERKTSHGYVWRYDNEGI
jgi:group I intron endonuclease